MQMTIILKHKKICLLKSSRRPKISSKQKVPKIQKFEQQLSNFQDLLLGAFQLQSLW
ncbi:hypothetical protein HMPREF9505_00729 [Enterococcus faecalis TX0109]|nr:hypothetical protein HMPREF9505_00729 [Enterococcus faecalis TX0109]